VSNKKRRDQAAADKELQEQKKKADEGLNDDEPTDVFGTQEDDDVIF
jgi:hypothetical protein